MNKKVVIIHRGVDADPRCAKIIESLWEKEYEICFVGWDSNPSVEKPSFHNVPIKKAIVKYQAPSGFKALLYFPQFFLHVYKNLLSFKPAVVHCVNEEVALPLLIFKRILFSKLVVDIFDSLGLRIRSNNILVKIARSLCNLTYYFADLIIVTNSIRYDLMPPCYQRKTIIVENSIDGEPYASEPRKADVVRLCVSGALSKSRGLEQLLMAVDHREDVKIIALGILADDFAKTVFINHPKVEYLGFFAQCDGLRIASGCDAIYAYYEPSNVNNIYASPNKIFDAMFVGKPIIVNSETLVSKWIEEKQLGYRVPYCDTEKLGQVLSSLRNRSIAEQQSFRQRVQNFFIKEYSWEKMKKRLLDAYDGLT